MYVIIALVLSIYKIISIIIRAFLTIGVIIVDHIFIGLLGGAFTGLVKGGSKLFNIGLRSRVTEFLQREW